MATTMYFDETLVDAAALGEPMEIEFGRSTFLDGKPLIYLSINGKSILMDEAAGKRFVEVIGDLGDYFGYNR